MLTPNNPTVALWLPHPVRAWPEGHGTRAKVIHAATGARVVEGEIGHPDVLIVDTNPLGPGIGLLEQLKADGTKLILLAKRVSPPAIPPLNLYHLVVRPGPYEGDGTWIGPLVDIPDVAPIDIEVLVVASRWPTSRIQWAHIAAQLRAAGQLFTILAPEPFSGHVTVQGTGRELIGRAEIVIGGAGLTLYETLWAGKRLVAFPFDREQQLRLAAARAAGEAVVEAGADIPAALEAARQLTPMERRVSGARQLAWAIKYIAGAPESVEVSHG